MLEILKTENYKVQAYSHQENGIAERVNREIRRHLKIAMHENKDRQNWDEYCLKVQAILNEKRSETTGLRPNEIVFAGRLYPRPTEVKWKKSQTL